MRGWVFEIARKELEVVILDIEEDHVIFPEGESAGLMHLDW